jgi:transposase
MKHLKLDKYLNELNEQQLLLINKQITRIEKDIEILIRADEHMRHQAALIRLVPGAGKVLCWMMLAKTEGFTAITEPRKMACYSGVVPFDNQSGTSLKGKNRVSSYADKTIKTVLHLAAMSAIRLKNDLSDYYHRKVAQGKNKMSVLNAVRNKIVHRIFAVIKNQQPYQNQLLLS